MSEIKTKTAIMQTSIQQLSEIVDNVVLMDKPTVESICEGMNVILASFQTLYLQYQKHHFVIAGAEFYMVHHFFEDAYKEVNAHVYDIGERLNGLGVVPAASFYQLATLCCSTPEPDGRYPCRQMLEHNLVAE